MSAKLHERISSVAPIEGVSVGRVNDKATWTVRFAAGATQNQRNAAQAVIDAWTDADWEGTAAERKRNRLEDIAALHTRRAALTIERDYWQAQGSTAKVTMLNTLLADAQARIDELRPQT